MKNKNKHRNPFANLALLLLFLLAALGTNAQDVSTAPVLSSAATAEDKLVSEMKLTAAVQRIAGSYVYTIIADGQPVFSCNNNGEQSGYYRSEENARKAAQSAIEQMKAGAMPPQQLCEVTGIIRAKHNQ